MSIPNRVRMVEVGYLGNWKNYPDDEKKILVMRNRGNDELAPSVKLLEDWKKGQISWEEYERRFREEMERPESREKIEELRNRVGAGENIRLICFEKNPPCHRFILRDLIG